MFERLSQAISTIRDITTIADARSLSGAEAADLLKLASEAEHVAAALRVTATRHVAESKVWQRSKYQSAAHYVAAATGSTITDADGALRTARRLEELPLARAAFQSGELSEAQVTRIADAAIVAPAQERALIGAAAEHTVAGLGSECARVKAAATSDAASKYERLYQKRSLRQWLDHEGMFNLHLRTTPDQGAIAVAAVDSRQAKVFDHARKAGIRDSAHAYAADALVDICRDAAAHSTTAKNDQSAPEVLVCVNVDHKVLTSGVVENGDTCEIEGIGPIPAATAQMLLSDSILKVIVKDRSAGSDVRKICKASRTISSRMRTAIEKRDATCQVSGCDRRHGLEIDHVVPLANGGKSELKNLVRLCRPHHRAKTYRGYKITGTPGNWRWLTPDDQEAVPDNPDPPPDG